MNTSLKKITPLLIVFTILLASNFIDAAWVAPGGEPSEVNNASAPLNLSTVNQLKEGDITARNLKAGNEMWSPKYCDENGENCDTSGGGGGFTGGRFTFHEYTKDWHTSNVSISDNLGIKDFCALSRFEFNADDDDMIIGRCEVERNVDGTWQSIVSANWQPNFDCTIMCMGDSGVDSFFKDLD